MKNPGQSSMNKHGAVLVSTAGGDAFRCVSRAQPRPTRPDLPGSVLSCSPFLIVCMDPGAPLVGGYLPRSRTGLGC